MLKINRISIAQDNKLEMSTISDEGQELKFELLFEDIPMLIQMLFAAKQQQERKSNAEPTVMLNFVEGWEVFSLPEEHLPVGVGIHFQCAGGFDFSFAVTDEDDSRSSRVFLNDLSSLMNNAPAV